ncbi:cytochrome C biogenesis protein [Hanstruepera neustonica]|uniref:Cytochrome C biogenesis protein n=1 Tax=Hanstruepera neustonica TaxID=1445657 RepID=A0A2K1DXT0_9FLAO|nr:cytochrome c biogenesis protein CcsA [Hanstruepera neustonica]PNQ72817.1 cytochrome C biogenesis protein [Hanstruepera neustonica]
MLNKLSKILFSTRLTSILFIAFAAAMAIGTFMDAGQETSPTPYTRNLIYNTWWFEGIMVLFVINFLGNIKKYRLWRKEQWATLILHLSFILIILGAGITRYIGFEGMMAIREGETENTFLSQKTYITAYIDGDYMIDGLPQRKIVEEEVDFSPRLENSLTITESYNGQPVIFELEKFIASAEKDIVPNDEGEEYLKLVEAGGGAPHNHFLKVGEVQSLHNVLFSLNKKVKGAVNLTYEDGSLTIQSPFEGEYMTMATGQTGKLVKDSIQPLMLRSRYIIGNMQLVFPKPVIKGTFDIVKKSQLLKGDEDGVVLKVTSNGETKRVRLLGGQGYSKPFEVVTVGGLDIAVKYGSKILELPFSVKLNDFIADKYPGTEKSYSAFASEVTVLDKEQGDFNYRIFMNNILDHRGYRFFQSGFDPDEKGTKLSVNHDMLGTWTTYIGYFLLYLGLMAILFDKNSRFADLKRLLEKVKDKKAKTLTVLFIAFALQGFAQQHSADDGHDHSKPSKEQIDSILKANITPKDHADKFGHLVIQDVGGRMMPVNTFASEMLRKLSKHDTYEGFDANQVFLSIQESPLLWYNVPIIYLKPKKGDSIRSLIGVEKDQKYVALVDFFTPEGNYKLAPYLEEAYKAQIPNGFQKEFKETDQRVNLLYNTIDGYALRIFPIPDDENNKWISSIEFRRDGYREQIKDTLYGNFINNGFSAYLMTLNMAKKSGDYSQVNEILESFTKTQNKYGSEVMLSEKKVKTEIAYNKYDIFKKLFSWYLYAGSLMFVFLIIQIFNHRSKSLNLVVTVFKWLIVGLFLLHTVGLIVRWYISGHAPWSDAYESMIYVAWATMFFGLAFGRKSDLTIASTAFVTSMILMVAHWNWMDPAIANLQPVLDSYWLMIHVAVIVASYGPFTLGMILGVVVLLLMIFSNKNNYQRLQHNIQELTIINEMALTVGLVMLTIGNFLGGMWANESWGRYWGWDPKETWALISIMIYAFVIHMRLVPGLRGRFGFNLASIVAFSSIMMTYFGVNFYLAGLHSYASGDQIVSVKFIAIAFGIVAILGILAYRKYAKFYKK